MHLIVFNATFNNTSVISWWSVLLEWKVKDERKATLHDAKQDIVIC